MGCSYQGYEFDAPYLDSVCVEGYLWDADSGDADGEGWLFTSGGDIPCPKCNTEEYRVYLDESGEEMRAYLLGRRGDLAAGG